jgi:hypothetical protein
MSTAAAAAELNARSRAFSNTVAKANLAKASASLNHAKQVSSNPHQAAKIKVFSK